MPINKMAFVRWRLIDQFLQNRQKVWTVDALRKAIEERVHEEFDIESGCSLRTLENDIAHMRKDSPIGYAAPIERKQGVLSYTDPNFSINNMPLTDHDIHLLKDSIHLLQHFKGLPHTELLHLMLEKIQHSPISNTYREKPAFIELESNPQLKGSQWISPIYESNENKKDLLISYQAFTEDVPSEHFVRVGQLREYNNRWFMIAYVYTKAAWWTFALDRILNIEFKEREQAVSPSAMPDFSNIIGVTLLPNASPEEIVFRVNPKRAPYIDTKPIHPSQKKLKMNNSCVEFQIKVAVNNELQALLLSFGSDLEVISPLSLKEKIKSELTNALQQYQ